MNKTITLRVENYSPTWPIEFESEKLLLKNSLDSLVVTIHHIGSTAVEGLAAKPIIDILLETKSLEFLDKAKPIFNTLGYEVMGEFGIPGRRYYRKGGDNRTHQIHAFVSGDENVHRHLAFRDYLKNHPEVQLEYQNLKFELAKSCHNDIECYCDGKDHFVKFHEAKALEWIACSSATINATNTRNLIHLILINYYARFD